MRKIIPIVMIAIALIVTGCGNKYQQEVTETGNIQKYEIADLKGDDNDRNVFMATTVYGQDFGFKLLLPNYWELKTDDKNEFNTDIYLSSGEYEGDSCIVLPGTIGYAVPAEWEKEQWQTSTTYGVADDWYFYETISETERKPVFRSTTFTDTEGNYYSFELRFPETGYENCDADFSNMIASFNTLSIPIDEINIEEEAVYKQKLNTAVFIPYGDEENEIVINYPADWTVTDNAEDITRPILTDTDTNCINYITVPPIDVTGYTEDVIVLDNNDMAKKYTKDTGEEVIVVTHNEKTYYFALKNVTEDSITVCTEEFETMVKSFRTYAEENATSGTGTTEE